MPIGKTRCNQCNHADKKAYEMPCSECAEIQFEKKKFDNQFLDANKNFMKED